LQNQGFILFASFHYHFNFVYLVVVLQQEFALYFKMSGFECYKTVVSGVEFKLFLLKFIATIWCNSVSSSLFKAQLIVFAFQYLLGSYSAATCAFLYLHIKLMGGLIG
jgi:hypothetical protein